MYTTLITAEQLQSLTADAAQNVRIIDCTSDLMDAAAGRQQFEAQHIAGAIYADLNTDLSAHTSANAASGGRHPLPNREHFAHWLRQIGLTPHTQVVAYDRNSMNFCGRLWWMLKWMGHDAVAVLDGGLGAWLAMGGAVAHGQPHPPTPSNWEAGKAQVSPVSAETVMAHLGRPEQTIIDARAAPRYRGEVEPLDPVAGHIPGALNRPFVLNLDDNGHFKSAEQLRTEFLALLAGRAPESVVHQCGSGVSALPNMLAMSVAGLHGSQLFAGSWSEWCQDRLRPVERG
ncbi:MAG: sulfurtransferase [Aquabacterium sp.]|uniref:sulfurtransferase n=1 Tax=Aquabacterium sp. TaxID=1872578 RepID=UPI003BD04FFF